MATLNTKTGQTVDRSTLESMLRRRLFYTPSFEIYGGVSGLYDYGPPGCALQANIVDLWRKHFVLEEDMLEVDCTMLTPHEVLKTSGHVDKFADWMCKDPKTGEIFRADHLVEEVLESRLKGDKEARGEKVVVDEEKEAKKKKKVKETKAVKLEDAVVKEYEEVLAQIDNFDGDGLATLIAKYDIRNPATGGNLLPPVAFNLMFQTSIGPSSNMPGYLRPETAQGQFLNFQKLLEFNQQSMPFASASIGKSFRNEISPRAGLLRVREFLMAEIEHFVDPAGGKKHPRFVEVKDVEMALLNRDVQLSGSTKVELMTIGKAVETGLVDNETLGYFLARIQLFLERLGVDKTKLRFRQHMANEMAHYAADCWDAELQTSYGWIECVGCADRSAYDLSVHKNKTGAPLVVRETRAEPLKIEEWQIDLEKKKFGPRFKKDSKTVEAAVEALSQELREKLSLELAETGKVVLDVEGVASGKVELEKDLITIEKRTRVENVREYTPNVIEPSFGIGRILYCLMEHVYWSRAGDEARGVLSFPPVVAPSKVLLVPLSTHASFRPLCQRLTTKLRRLGVSNRVDDSSASIGKRYARNDELGTPFGITVDFQSVKDNTFTLRDRDSTKQVRASEDEILQALKSLVEGDETWEDVRKRLPELLFFLPFSFQKFYSPTMAPTFASAKLTLSCPLFAADFDPRNQGFLLVGGGGGEGRSGVGNKIIVDIELSRDEDSVTSLAAAYADDDSVVALAGINSSQADQLRGENRHLRSFKIDYPQKVANDDKTNDKTEEEASEKKAAPKTTTPLSQVSLFRSKARKGKADTYQRILRLSPWRGAERARVGVVATGLAPSGEIVFFSATSSSPSSTDVVGRIQLGDGEEAEDVDIIDLPDDNDTGKFRVAYTNGVDIFTCEISSETRSNVAPEVRCVLKTPLLSGQNQTRPKFRALRFLSPTALLVLRNAPNRTGCELVLVQLPPTTGAGAEITAGASGKIIQRRKLRRAMKMGLGMDVCNLGANEKGEQQSIIAVSGGDQSIEICTVEYYPSSGRKQGQQQEQLQQQGSSYSKLRLYTTLRDVHPFSMTQLRFSTFTPPTHPITSAVGPQAVRLASVSMGNTVVVHRLPLSPYPPNSRSSRYVLHRPGPSQHWETAYSCAVALFMILLACAALQAFTEIRGLTPPHLGATNWLPTRVRDVVARPYMFAHLHPELTPSGVPSSSSSSSDIPSVQVPHRSLRDLLRAREINAKEIPDGSSAILVTVDGGNVLVQAGNEQDPRAQARAWEDMPEEDRRVWKQRLVDAGHWTVEEGEHILTGVLFAEYGGLVGDVIRGVL
ncbi:hypothetical protein ASPZODRAFT_60297 [Penicilliopsis zonata CBS 506.65]|uniref:glycine--tRNA ligase n=1 Tax=Penicilliopsis zonata CBS 506.65 TaxID=1073090 RepID=A0A1L9SNI0_9EURO|nr:hypothetical protein ASPZODRAFT_60297 [Penicilliopsis zonata CBS 506.65]OJJ48802.1 hypothetical protein ASPZODRAFT_60297 [Penicilliopsis zonata CBS 506.65]